MAGLRLQSSADVIAAACSACGSRALAYALPGHADISPLRCSDCGSFSGSLSDIEVVEHTANEGLD